MQACELELVRVIMCDVQGTEYRVPQFATCQSDSTFDMFEWSLFATSSS